MPVTLRNVFPARSLESSLKPLGSVNSTAAPSTDHTAFTVSIWTFRNVTIAMLNCKPYEMGNC